MKKLISLDYQPHPEMGKPEPFFKSEEEVRKCREGLEEATREQLERFAEARRDAWAYARTYVFD